MDNQPIKKVLDVAKSYIGYLEKETNSDLDSFKGNAGNKNYTKFARDFFPELQGLQWCCMFVYACFAYALGPIMAQNTLSGCKTAKCSHLYEVMSAHNRILSENKDVQKGDLVFFNSSGVITNRYTDINHIGIVSDVKDNRIETIEGNTSNGSNNEVIPNGGSVCRKQYDITNTRIYGIGRPVWDIVPEQNDNQHKIISATGVVTGNGVSLRKGSNIYTDRIGTLDKNQPLKIISKVKSPKDGNYWYEVETTLKGYIRSDYVKED